MLRLIKMQYLRAVTARNASTPLFKHPRREASSFCLFLILSLPLCVLSFCLKPSLLPSHAIYSSTIYRLLCSSKQSCSFFPRPSPLSFLFRCRSFILTSTHGVRDLFFFPLKPDFHSSSPPLCLLCAKLMAKL